MDEIKKLYDKTRDLLKKWGVTDEEADDFMKELMETADKNDDGDITEEVEEAKEEIEEKGEDPLIFIYQSLFFKKPYQIYL